MSVARVAALPRRRFFEVALGVASLALVAALPALPRAAHAAGPRTKATLLVLHGTQTEGAGSIDPRIGDLPQLKKRPLSSYNTYRLLDSQDLDLEEGTPATYAAPNGSTLSILLTGITDDHRYTIREELSGGKLRRPLHVEVTTGVNDYVFVGGLHYQGGAIFFGITIKP